MKNNSKNQKKRTFKLLEPKNIGKMSLKTDSGQQAFYNYGDMASIKNAVHPLVASNCSEYAVGFSNYSMRPARNIGEVELMAQIVGTMRSLGLNSFLRLHSYSWPHLGKGMGHGVMIVSAPRSGRTFAYLPPLCHNICVAVEKIVRHPELHTALSGPLAVIVVANTEQVHHVSVLCYALLKKSCPWLDQFTLTLNVPPDRERREFGLRVLNGVGCLVATPAQLEWAKTVLGKGLRFQDMRYLVFDNVDLMNKVQLEMSNETLKSFLPKGRKPQVVIVSQAYKSDLFAQLSCMNESPAIIFGDILEASIYGGAKFRISLTAKDKKVHEVIRVVCQRSPRTYRTVIFCDDDREMRQLVETLEDHAQECLPYFQNADLADLERVNRWKQDHRSEILLCTDLCPELDIRSAHTLIHYGLSRTWSKFKLRHLFLADHFRNSLQPGSSEATQPLSLQSFAIVDDGNQRQLPRLVDFLQQHQPVENSLVNLSKQIRLKTEDRHKSVLCPQLMIMGACNAPHCGSRHRLTQADIRLPHLPDNGDIKVELVRVYSPTHYCVRIQEHKPPNSGWVSKMPLVRVDMRLHMVGYTEAARYWPPVAGDLCLFRDKGLQERVRVLKVAPIEQGNLVQNNLDVEVQALDRDTRVFFTTCSHLYVCPEELRQEPPTCVDVRLLGLVPMNGERSWTEAEKRETEQWLVNVNKKHFMQATVELATAHTIYVKDLVVMVYAQPVRIHPGSCFCPLIFFLLGLPASPPLAFHSDQRPHRPELRWGQAEGAGLLQRPEL